MPEQDRPPTFFIIRRRYTAGIRNFFDLYAPLVDAWRVYDNAAIDSPKLMASRTKADDIMIAEVAVWNRFCQQGRPT